MQLAQGEIMKAEAEFGRDVGVRILLMRKADVQSDGLGSDIKCSTVGGLHHSRPSAGYDDRMVFASAMIRIAHEMPEFASHLVIMTLGMDSLSNCQSTLQFHVTWVGYQRCAQHLHLATRSCRLANPRAPKNHDRLMNLMLFKQQLGLEIVDL